MTYGDFKDKILKDKAFHIKKNPKYDGHLRGLASLVHRFFDKKSKRSGFATHENKSTVNIEVNPGEQLAKALRKPIIRNF